MAPWTNVVFRAQKRIELTQSTKEKQKISDDL